MYFCLFGTIFLLTQHLQELLGYGTLAAGIRTVPFAMVLMIVANLTPRIVGRFGHAAADRGRAPGRRGLAAAAHRVDAHSGYGIILVSQVTFAFGMGLLIAPATASIMGAVPAAQAGAGSAINDTTRQVGGALGVAVMGSFAAAGFRDSLAHRVPGVAAGARDSLGAALETARGLGAGAAGAAVGHRRARVVHPRTAPRVRGSRFAVALIGAFVAWRLLPGGVAISGATTATDAVPVAGGAEVAA